MQTSRDTDLNRIDDKQIENLLANNAAVPDRVSALRLALRAKRTPSQRKDLEDFAQKLEREITQLYQGQYTLATTPADKLRYARWTCRYSGESQEGFDWRRLTADFLASVEGDANYFTKLRKCAGADLELRIDYEKDRVSSDGFPILIDGATPALPIISRFLLSGKQSAAVELEHGPWSFALRTEEGPKPPNQDAGMVTVFSDDSCLVAVADGTGDSHDGLRAAEITLLKLAEYLELTGQLDLSIELAAAAVRADNLARKQENSCTLVALHIEPKTAHIAHLSDSFYWIQTVDSTEPMQPSINKSCRVNIGGEPLGYVITSSGNRVQYFSDFNDPQVNPPGEISGLSLFVLGCDALFFAMDERVAPTAGCSALDEFARRDLTPHAISENLVRLSLKSMQMLHRRDNITCIAGLLNL